MQSSGRQIKCSSKRVISFSLCLDVTTSKTLTRQKFPNFGVFTLLL